ncbi:hypothetical protein N431DRAFT_117346 [Stipitochalara longipes BDJ]|nr:hypothetical protein N431DRAFT_117346 [Stipitochalara longipes BDJ]
MRMGLSEPYIFPIREPCCLACVTPKPIIVPGQEWKVGDGRFDDLFLMKQLMNPSVMLFTALYVRSRRGGGIIVPTFSVLSRSVRCCRKVRHQSNLKRPQLHALQRASPSRAMGSSDFPAEKRPCYLLEPWPGLRFQPEKCHVLETRLSDEVLLANCRVSFDQQKAISCPTRPLHDRFGLFSSAARLERIYGALELLLGSYAARRHIRKIRF